MCRASFAGALLVLFIASPSILRADITGFGDFSGYTINWSNGSAPTPVTGGIQLINSSAAQVRSIFYDTPQPVSEFTATFTYQTVSGGEDGGASFILLNATDYGSAGPTTVASSPFYYGYGGMNNSVGITLGISSPATTALFTNGDTGSGSSASPVSTVSNDPINVTLTYNGALLQETLTDATTLQSYSTSYLINLSSYLGSSAYVGFGAGAGDTLDNAGPSQNFTNFQYVTSVVPEPSTAVLGIIGGGLAMLGWRRCRRRLAGV